jgi:predicted HicB family RNase H-like nuclease
MQESGNHLIKIGFDDDNGRYWAKIINSPSINTIWADTIQELRDAISITANQSAAAYAKPAINDYPNLLFSVQISSNLFFELADRAETSGLSVDNWVNRLLAETLEVEHLAEPVV